LRSTTKCEYFQWLKFFRCYSLLWVPDIKPNCFNLHKKNIKKVIARLYFCILRNEITEKQCQIRNFAEVRNFAWHRVRRKNAESCRSRLRHSRSVATSDACMAWWSQKFRKSETSLGTGVKIL